MGTTIVIIAIGAIVIYLAHRSALVFDRDKFIQAYEFPRKISESIISTYPHLTTDDAEKVVAALRDYFSLCNTASLSMVSMPSRAVDAAWHEFILFTRQYMEFCNQAFGSFLHHTPAEAMKTRFTAQDGIRRAWNLSCKRENINPMFATRLPLLFSIDSDLNIPDGFRYSLNCDNKENTYCAGHINYGVGCGGGCSGGSDGCGGGGCGGGD